jgi:hypothetical protein
VTRWLKFEGLGRRLIVVGLVLALAVGLTVNLASPSPSNALSGAHGSDTSYGPVPNFMPRYWKTHAAITTALLPQSLGNYSVSTYAEAEDVLSEVGCSQVGGLNCMAEMLVAAELNLADGGSTCIVTNGTTNAAKNLLTKYSYSGPGTVYTLSAADQSLAISLYDELSAYNIDRVPACSNWPLKYVPHAR